MQPTRFLSESPKAFDILRATLFSTLQLVPNDKFPFSLQMGSGQNMIMVTILSKNQVGIVDMPNQNARMILRCPHVITSPYIPIRNIPTTSRPAYSVPINNSFNRYPLIPPLIPPKDTTTTTTNRNPYIYHNFPPPIPEEENGEVQIRKEKPLRILPSLDELKSPPDFNVDDLLNPEIFGSVEVIKTTKTKVKFKKKRKRIFGYEDDCQIIEQRKLESKAYPKFLCPITQEVMICVEQNSCGHSYSHEGLMGLFEQFQVVANSESKKKKTRNKKKRRKIESITCPVHGCKVQVTKSSITRNVNLEEEIQMFRETGNLPEKETIVIE